MHMTTTMHRNSLAVHVSATINPTWWTLNDIRDLKDLTFLLKLKKSEIHFN